MFTYKKFQGVVTVWDGGYSLPQILALLSASNVYYTAFILPTIPIFFDYSFQIFKDNFNVFESKKIY